jgi:DNA-binding MarR family transcriptional regulator
MGRDMKATIDPAVALLDALYLRPGFLLRRAHQLSVGLFEEQCRELALTPPQYGVLTIVSHAAGCDQATVARALGFDRVTTLRIVRGLLARELMASAPSSADARRVQLTLTAAGRQVQAQAATLAAGVTQRLMAPLDSTEQQALQLLLHKLCAGLEPQARTRLQAPGR